MKVAEGVYKYLDLSTAHITKGDDEILRKDDGTANIGIIADPHPFGYWVYVPQDVLVEDLIAAKLAGFSADFRRLIAKASRLKCFWVKLDQDGNVYDDLPKHNW